MNTVRDGEGKRAVRQKKQQRGIAKVTVEASGDSPHTYTHSTNTAPSSRSSPSLSVVNSSVIFPPSSPLRSSLAPLFLLLLSIATAAAAAAGRPAARLPAATPADAAAPAAAAPAQHAEAGPALAARARSRPGRPSRTNPAPAR